MIKSTGVVVVTLYRRGCNTASRRTQTFPLTGIVHLASLTFLGARVVTTGPITWIAEVYSAWVVVIAAGTRSCDVLASKGWVFTHVGCTRVTVITVRSGATGTDTFVTLVFDGAQVPIIAARAIGRFSGKDAAPGIWVACLLLTRVGRITRVFLYWYTLP
jgi:hypothetical protein